VTGRQGFFSQRRPLEFLERVRQKYEIQNCPNIHPLIATIISSGKATIYELKTIYSVEDAFMIWEVISVDGYNEYAISQEIEKNSKRG